MELRETAWNLLKTVDQVILGKSGETREVLAAMLTGGHVLLEDIPEWERQALQWHFQDFWGSNGTESSLRRMFCRQI